MLKGYLGATEFTFEFEFDFDFAMSRCNFFSSENGRQLYPKQVGSLPFNFISQIKKNHPEKKKIKVGQSNINVF